MPYRGLSLYGFLPEAQAMAHARNLFADNVQAEARARWERAAARLEAVPRGTAELRAPSAAALRQFEQIRADPAFPSMVPAPCRIVEISIGALLSPQSRVNVAQVESALARFGERPTPEEILEGCLPTSAREIPEPYAMDIEAGGVPTFSVLSENVNLRMVGMTSRRQEQRGELHLTLAFSFGNPHVTVARYRGRLLVRNGHHRLLALAMRGVPFAPCLLQEAAAWRDVTPGGLTFFPEEVVFARQPAIAHYPHGEPASLRRTTKMVRVRAEDFLLPVDVLPHGGAEARPDGP